jgi:hypothetical protein
MRGFAGMTPAAHIDGSDSGGDNLGLGRSITTCWDNLIAAHGLARRSEVWLRTADLEQLAP